MTDRIKVKVLKQKVFHDGKSMIVLKPNVDDQTVPQRFIASLVSEKVIVDPEAQPLDLDTSDDGDEREDTLPVLTGKNKAQLLAIAEDEGVDIAEGSTNAQIAEAIEAHRAEADAADDGSDGDAPAA